jgi:hypothetical protein
MNTSNTITSSNPAGGAVAQSDPTPNTSPSLNQHGSPAEPDQKSSDDVDMVDTDAEFDVAFRSKIGVFQAYSNGLFESDDKTGAQLDKAIHSLDPTNERGLRDIKVSIETVTNALSAYDGDADHGNDVKIHLNGLHKDCMVFGVKAATVLGNTFTKLLFNYPELIEQLKKQSPTVISSTKLLKICSVMSIGEAEGGGEMEGQFKARYCPLR